MCNLLILAHNPCINTCILIPHVLGIFRIFPRFYLYSWKPQIRAWRRTVDANLTFPPNANLVALASDAKLVNFWPSRLSNSDLRVWLYLDLRVWYSLTLAFWIYLSTLAFVILWPSRLSNLNLRVWIIIWPSRLGITFWPSRLGCFLTFAFWTSILTLAFESYFDPRVWVISW
jgi:hypothetical protein